MSSDRSLSQVGGEAGSKAAGEVFVQQMDGAKLVLGDAVRAAEIVWLGAPGGIVFVGDVVDVAENIVAEKIVDFFLRQGAVRAHTPLSALLCPKVSCRGRFFTDKT